jgi:hypothetical protein
VVIVEGGFPDSGGSMKSPSLSEDVGTVLEIRDVPLGLVESYRARSTGNADAVTVVSITRLEDRRPEDSRLIAFVTIRALMAEHGITTDDLL